MKITPSSFPETFEDKLQGMANDDRELIGRIASGKRNYELKVNPIEGSFDINHLSKIHRYLFQDVSTHAGVVRNYGMSKGGNTFADPPQMSYLHDKELPQRIESLNQSVNDKEQYIDGMADLHSTLDLAHPFRDGNGRATRAFMSQLAIKHGYELDFSQVKREQWIEACVDSMISGQETLKRKQLEQIVSPTRERVVESAIVNLSADNSKENLQKIASELKEQGIKPEEIAKGVETLKSALRSRDNEGYSR